ncbi:MAG: magnesium transporter CorA family protein, partial [Erysipelotrichaceae bacterium]|nr:magnesium transporter CorA family protein [Erysipelotrichaceae bacterium]
MIKIYLTKDGKLESIDKPQKGCWINLVHPTEKELQEIEDKYHIESEDLRAPLDEEEASRFTKEDDYTLVLVDIPTIEEKNGKNHFSTIPMGIIV